jgi:hypothetical protein
MSIVKGDNCIVLIYNSGMWKNYVCARDCSLDTQTDMIETSVSGAGKYATFEPTKNSFSGTMGGLISLNVANALTLPELRALQLSHTKLLMRFTRTDDNANVYTDECYFYITGVQDSGPFGDLASFSVSLRGTGGITQIFVPTPQTQGIVNRYEYTGTGMEYGFTEPLLIGKNVIEANKDGIGNSKLILSGTPVNKECLFDSTTGAVTWAIPFEAGEEAYLLYQ